MSYGSTAYETFVRIHLESGITRHKPWNHLSHVRRLAWEAAAQAVAMAVLPEFARGDDEDEEDSSTEAEAAVDEMSAATTSSSVPVFASPGME